MNYNPIEERDDEECYVRKLMDNDEKHTEEEIRTAVRLFRAMAGERDLSYLLSIKL